MFDLLKSGLKKIFGGSKQDKDIARYQPLVDLALVYYATLQELSNDELRDHTVRFRQTVQEGLTEINAQINDTRQRANEVSEPEQIE